MDNPHEVQKEIFSSILRKSENTEWGRKYGYSSISTWEDFDRKVPVSTYDQLQPYIGRMMHGEMDVLWPGKTGWFSKSSGTTNDKSKFIPVSIENLKKCHFKGSWDVLTLAYENKPDANIFGGKNLVMGGTVEPFSEYPETMIGDISGIMIKNSPPIGRRIQTPDLDTSLIADWNVKIEKLADMTIQQNLKSVGGVPTWAIVLFRRILQKTGKQNMLEIWPEIEFCIHGGVAFDPYRESFKRLFPSEHVKYLEVYNASEGYFGIQNDLNERDLLLLLDNQIFYEFIPFESYDTPDQKVLPLEDVEKDKNYVLLISTNSGLWRYVVGDTIRFTSLAPYKIKITGRVQHFINVFGEEVMVSNTDKAVAKTCAKHKAAISDYTVAPIYLRHGKKGGHEWLVEFEKMPQDLKSFTHDLDLNLQSINSDYEAKRFDDLALSELKLSPLPQGSFYKWMELRGKLGGQNKVPRLSNERKYVEAILEFINDK